MNCFSCQSLQKEISLSPAAPVLEGAYWQVEHVYPVSLVGWLVVVLKRHVEALHELTKEEFTELAVIQEKVTKVLHTELKTEKEYSICLAEKEGFHHIHFHMIGVPIDLPADKRGAHIFSLLGVPKDKAVSEKDVVNFSDKLRYLLQ